MALFVTRASLLQKLGSRCLQLCISSPRTGGTSYRFCSDNVNRGKPKKPLNGFMKYKIATDEDLRKNNPSSRASELAKIAGDMYRSLSESEKEVYKADYKGELETYKDEVKKWEESQTKEDKDLAKKMRAKKKKQKLRRQTKKECRAYEKPKRPLNAYYLFMLEYRPQAIEDIAADTEPKKKYCVVTALLAAKWKILPDSEKQVFKDMAATQKLEREIALSDWEKQMIELKNYHLLRKSTLKEKKLVITPDNATSKESKRSKAEKKSGS